MVKKVKILLIIILLFCLFLIHNLINPTLISESENALCEDCNIILITVDALRADHLEAYGYYRNTSPTIDEFANQSILFLNAFTQSSWSPLSFSSIFTSLYPSEIYNLSAENHLKLSLINKSVLTLPEIMKQNDFTTLCYANGPYLNSFYGFNKGCDLFYEEGIFDEDYGDIESVNRRVFEQLQKTNGKRFYLFIHYMDVHCPYDTSPEPFFSMYDPFYNGSLNLTDKCGWTYFNFINLSKADVERIIAAYDGGIRYADENIGELLSKLEELNLMNNTIIIITADHGEELKDHGLIGHSHSLYDELIHVPLIIKIPGIKHRVITDQVESIDILPTILDILEIPIPNQVEGNSLVPLILDQENWNKSAVSEIHNKTSIRTKKFKLIKNMETGEKELYDLKNDPKEQVNVINDYPEVARRSEEMLEQKFN